MPAQLERAAHRLLSEQLQVVGFLPAELLSFYRDMDGYACVLNIPTRREKSRMCFTCIPGVRFDQVNSLLSPDNKDPAYPTVCCPIHLLAPEQRFYEWEAGNSEELEISVNSMIQEIYDVGFSFFERFSTIEAVEQELLLPGPSPWLVISSHQRTGILAAIAILRGDRASAEKVFDDSLQDPDNLHPGRRRRLLEMRKQLMRV